jgi:peptidoglycan/LPS O-acetylase OafA/YrhL
MPELDGLRALAILIVLLAHWVPEVYQPVEHLGRLGVLLFFVLSGYLITGILLDCRALVQSGVETPGFALKQFYIRRFLRIFPVYYAILIVGYLLGLSVIRETMAWHVTYTSNVYFAIRGAWQGAISHLWSLSVEEQFYLMWPALILFLPRRVLPTAIFGLILMAPIFRGIGSLTGLNPVAVWVLTPGCLDTLGAGAFLALAEHSPNQVPHWLHGKCGWLPWIGLPLLLGMMGLSRVQGDTSLYLALSDIGAALVSVFLVAKASNGIPGIVGRTLEWRPITYLGRISYGVYLLHPFVTKAIRRLASNLVDVHDTRYAIPLLLCYFTATIILASLSWRFLETPLNELKRFFPYRRQSKYVPGCG